MKCVICKTGELHQGLTAVTLQRERMVFVARDVPAQICDDCGEYYLDETIAQTVYARAEESFQRHAEVEIQTYALA